MLTPEQILRLPAGPELNAKVSELRGSPVVWTDSDGPYLAESDEGCGPQDPVPEWSTDWQHAYPLLEEMRQKRAYIQLTVWWGDHYSVSCDQIPGGTGAVISGKDGPEAIAKAWCLWRLQQQEVTE